MYQMLVEMEAETLTIHSYQLLSKVDLFHDRGVSLSIRSYTTPTTAFLRLFNGLCLEPGSGPRYFPSSFQLPARTRVCQADKQVSTSMEGYNAWDITQNESLLLF